MESNIGHIPRKETLQIPTNIKQENTKLLKGAKRGHCVDWSLYWIYKTNLKTEESI